MPDRYNFRNGQWINCGSKTMCAFLIYVQHCRVVIVTPLHRAQHIARCAERAYGVWRRILMALFVWVGRLDRGPGFGVEGWGGVALLSKTNPCNALPNSGRIRAIDVLLTQTTISVINYERLCASATAQRTAALTWLMMGFGALALCRSDDGSNTLNVVCVCVRCVKPTFSTCKRIESLWFMIIPFLHQAFGQHSSMAWWSCVELSLHERTFVCVCVCTNDVDKTYKCILCCVLSAHFWRHCE